MRKHAILYDWPVSELTRLADSNVADAFAATLDNQSLTSFTTLTEQMRGLGADLVRAKADRMHFERWAEVRSCLESFWQQFPAFPGAVPRKARLWALLADKVAQSGAAMDADEIDPERFEIRDLLATVPASWFSKENATSFMDSVAVFCCDDPAKLESELGASNNSPQFLFHLLAALYGLPDVPPSHAVLVRRTVPRIEQAAVTSFAKLMMLTSGKCIHIPRRYSGGLTILDSDRVRAGTLYQQWSDVLDVLSEYNGREEVLLKYLTLYHVVENVMFKMPIVALERQKNGRMFSIRDFRRLYEQVSESEANALRKLIQTIFRLEAKPGVTFLSHVVARWKGLVPGTPAADLEAALGALGIKKDGRGLKHDEFEEDGAGAGYFAQLVYAVRCAIVHNKETEFHLTYASLDPSFLTLIESFLLPSLEEICFELVSGENPHVWYSKQDLALY